MQQDPIFSVSVVGAVTLGFLLIFLGLTLCVLSLTSPPVDIVFASMLFIAALLGVYIIYQKITAHVRSAQFYDSSFKVSGWKFKKEYPYSKVDDIIYVKGVSMISSPSITISVGTEEDPLVLLQNPRSVSVDSDLYSWLKLKCPQSRNSTSWVLSSFQGILVPCEKSSLL